MSRQKTVSIRARPRGIARLVRAKADGQVSGFQSARRSGAPAKRSRFQSARDPGLRGAGRTSHCFNLHATLRSRATKVHFAVAVIGVVSIRARPRGVARPGHPASPAQLQKVSIRARPTAWLSWLVPLWLQSARDPPPSSPHKEPPLFQSASDPEGSRDHESGLLRRSGRQFQSARDPGAEPNTPRCRGFNPRATKQGAGCPRSGVVSIRARPRGRSEERRVGKEC